MHTLQIYSGEFVWCRETTSVNLQDNQELPANKYYNITINAMIWQCPFRQAMKEFLLFVDDIREQWELPLVQQAVVINHVMQPN